MQANLNHKSENFSSPPSDKHCRRCGSRDCVAEIAELKRRIDGIERELAVLIRIECNVGLRQLSSDVYVDDALVNKFVDELSRDEGAR
jgi:hypothetical protein